MILATLEKAEGGKKKTTSHPQKYNII